MHSARNHDPVNVEAFASLKLTPREAEVLFWISQGKSNHDIGIILGAKTGTISKHCEHIFSKLMSKIARLLQSWHLRLSAL